MGKGEVKSTYTKAQAVCIKELYGSKDPMTIPDFLLRLCFIISEMTNAKKGMIEAEGNGLSCKLTFEKIKDDDSE